MRLLLKILFPVVVIGGIFEGVFRWSSVRKSHLETSYLASLIDKHRRVNTLSPPRILLIGGSNMAFGINSDLIEKTTRLSTTNLATQIILGTYFMLNQMRSVMKKGDKIIISLEYNITPNGDYETQLTAADLLPEACQWICKISPSQQVRQQVMHRIRFLKLCLGAWATPQPSSTIADTTSLFFRAGFSPKGDLLSHLNNPPQALQHSDLPVSADFLVTAKLLKDFCEDATKKGCWVGVSFPPYSVSAYKKNQTIIQKIYSQIYSQIPSYCIDLPKENVLADSLFFDSVYHLNAQGRQIRTQKLIANLRHNKVADK